MSDGFQVAAATTGTRIPKRRNIWVVWLLLPLITLGIYTIVWYYKVNKEAGAVSGEEVSPWTSVIAVTLGSLIIVPFYVSIYNTAQRIGRAQAAAGLTASCNGVIGILLTFCLGLWPLYYQSEMNGIVDAKAPRA